jgi:hypothetical protein
MAMGRLTHVFRKGMISAPEPGAVTTSTSCSVCQEHRREGETAVSEQAANSSSSGVI